MAMRTQGRPSKMRHLYRTLPLLRVNFAFTAPPDLRPHHGVAYYHAPIELQANADAELCRLAASRESALDIATRPLSEIGIAWDAHAASSRLGSRRVNRWTGLVVLDLGQRQSVR